MRSRLLVQGSVALALLILSFPVASAADSNVAPASPKEVAAADLTRLLAGGTPGGVSDLKAMQDHVRGLTAQLMKCTVGVQVGAAQGSGVIISKDGYVLTAAHVAGKPNVPVVFMLCDGRMLPGKTLGLNRTMDSGLMKIETKEELPFAEIGVSDKLNEGQWCLATGHPGGYQGDRQPVLRLGRVLLLDNSAITTDCTLVGGDSGGPLFDMQGKVIGINSRIASELKANMHVPVSTFKDTWDRLNASEAWGHFPGNEPYIGVRGEQGATDAKIATVVADSPAAKAGLQTGDIVTQIDGSPLADFASLSAAIRERQPGDRIKLVVKRGEETKEFRIKLGRKS